VTDKNDVLPEEDVFPQTRADRGLKPRKLGDVKEQMGEVTQKIKAVDLIDKPFVILSAKAFPSTLKQGSYAYYCECSNPKSGELFATVLGGGAVVEMLDKWCASGLMEPLLVTLRKVSGGRYGRYYVLE